MPSTSPFSGTQSAALSSIEGTIAFEILCCWVDERSLVCCNTPDLSQVLIGTYDLLYLLMQRLRWSERQGLASMLGHWLSTPHWLCTLNVLPQDCNELHCVML